MSVNLTIAIDRHFPADCRLMHTRLALSWQDYAAFDRMRAESTPLGRDVLWYEDGGLAERTTDPYGTPLTTIAAGALARHLASAHLDAMDSAVRAYVRALPATTPVLLWWH